MGLIDLAQERDRWGALVSAVMNRGEFLDWITICLIL